MASVLFPVGTMVACFLVAQEAGAQLINQRMSALPDKETIAVSMNGDYVPTFGLPSVSLAPISSRFTVFMWPASPRRRQYRLEGVDKTWQSGLCNGTISLRFFNDNGEQLSQQSEELPARRRTGTAAWKSRYLRPRKKR